MRIVVLRLGHRIPRDPRVTTHVALTARAFGAESMALAGITDRQLERTLSDVQNRFGGRFYLEMGVQWRQYIKRWKDMGGEVVHLTMYGLPLPEAITEIQRSEKDKLVVVGGEKVPGELFRLADWNVSVTNQPISEVAAMAVFLDWLTEHYAFTRDFQDAKIRLEPSRKGKGVVHVR